MSTAAKSKSAKAKKAPKGPKENGRPPHVPTDETRAQVQALCGFGMGEPAVAEFLDISQNTLRKHYGEVVRKARPKLMAMAGAGIFTALKKNEPWAIKYLHATLGKKFGWTERVEVVLPKDVFGNADPSRLTDAQWRTFVELLAIMGVDLTQHYPDYRPGNEARLIGSSNAV